MNVLSSESFVVFQEPWWLDAVAPGKWGEARIEQNGRCVARWPFLEKCQYGVRRLVAPPLTSRLGPWLDPMSEEKHVTQLGKRQELLKRLCDKLPQYDILSQNCAPEFTDWLPLYWRGFTQSTCYTYAIDSAQNIDELWPLLSKNTRQQIKRAKKSVEVAENWGPAKFYQFCNEAMSRKDMSYSYDEKFFVRLDTACAKRNARTILRALDAQGNVHAAIYLLFEPKRTYYLMGGTASQYRESAASYLLLWTAIQRSLERNATFDFEGSMIPSIERVFRGFGSKQVPYFKIEHNSKLGKSALLAHQVISSAKKKFLHH